MASFSLVTSKFGHAGASIARARAWNPSFFAAATPRPIHVPSNPEGAAAESVKHGASETVHNSLNESAQDKAYTTVENVKNKANEAANEASASAHKLSERAKHTMQNAWDSTKNTAHRAANTVLGKAEESAEYVKDNAEAVKKNMNRKN